jgi:predicted ATP-grasp superfamily ATP-dependent carboligase
MRVFVYEYLTAQGIGREPNSRDHAMYTEGRAMRDAVAEDFRRISGAEVVVFADDDAPVEPDDFSDRANKADWTLVIAPEAGGVLADLAETVWPLGSRLLGPSAAAIKLTSDKLALAEYWYDRDVPTPATSDRELSKKEAFPVVWKPQDGCGSAGTFLLTSPQDVARARAQRERQSQSSPMIVQEYVPGRAVSVGFLCGPAGNTPLLPCSQSLSDDGQLRYLGGEVPLPDDLAARAVKLGQRAVDCIRGLVGFVGVDLVLGEAANGSGDHAIEINPRLTTSYVGLRALAESNLAEAMLLAAKGELKEPPKWKTGRVRFAPDGSVSAV